MQGSIISVLNKVIKGISIINIMPLLVHNRQQMFFVSVLRELNPLSSFRVISHISSTTTTVVDIDTLIPDILGYHPSMERFISKGVRKYVKSPLIDLNVTDSVIRTEGMCYKYCVMNDENFCPILLAKLLTMKNVVVLDTTNTKRSTFYNNCTLPLNALTELTEWGSDQLRAKGKELYDQWILCPSFPGLSPLTWFTLSIKDKDIVVDHVPEDRYSLPRHALVTKDKDGGQRLTLSPTNGADTLPDIIIVTDLRHYATVTTCQQQLIRRCWLDNRYPINKITWVVNTHNGLKPTWWNWGGGHVKFNAETTADYIVFWELDYYYFPHSTYAKIKLLMDHPSINSVGSLTMGSQHILDNKGYTTTHVTPPLPLVAMRSCRYDREREITWQGHISKYMEFPFNYNGIHIDLSKEKFVLKDTEQELPVIKLLSAEMRAFLTGLYKKLARTI